MWKIEMKPPPFFFAFSIVMPPGIHSGFPSASFGRNMQQQKKKGKKHDTQLSSSKTAKNLFYFRADKTLCDMK